MQEKQFLENLSLCQTAKVLYDKVALYSDLSPDALKIIDLVNGPKAVSLGRLFAFSQNHSFTISEINIFVFVAKGFSNSEIAEKLVISKNTVRFHLKNIYKKTTIKSRLALIKFGYELGL